MRDFLSITVILCLLLASCASHTNVHPDPVNIQSVIQPGDKVKIVTIDNQEAEFEVTEVTDEYIIGESIKVSLEDITGMKEETASAGTNALLITIFTLSVGAAAVVGGTSIPYGASPASEAASDVLVSSAAVSGSSLIQSGYSSRYHPGDLFAFERSGIDIEICADECKAQHSCNNKVSNMDNSMQQYYGRASYGRARLTGMVPCPSLEACKYKCLQREYPKPDIATHIQGGFYSDGSYYKAGEQKCTYGYGGFENVHPTKDKYEKTQWQKDRDECMQLTSENVKCSFMNTRRSTTSPDSYFSLSKKYYRECLSERGYPVSVY